MNPSGLPYWARRAGISQYGGDPNKQNYRSQGKIDATTDVGADEWNRIAADLAALTRVAPVATIRVAFAAGAITVQACALPTGVLGVTSAYAGSTPPTGFPTVVYSGTDGGGNYLWDVTLPSSFSDDFGVSAAWTPVIAAVSLEGASAGASSTSITGSTVRVITTAASGTFDLTVW